MEFKREEEIPSDLTEWYYSPIYKTKAKGPLSEWKIGVKNGHIITVYGQVDGKLVTDRRKIVPKVNRTLFEQGLQEIQNKYLKKYREGYREEGDDSPVPVECMKAKTYISDGKKETKLKYPVGLTTKLDGIRCLVSVEKNKPVYRSRGNITYDHLGNVFDKSIKTFYSMFPKGTTFDGELFNPDLNFNDIVSSVKKVVNHDDVGLKENIKYYIFDTNEDIPYEDRWKNLAETYQKFVKTFKGGENMIVIVNTYWARDKCDLMWFHREIGNQFEGTMIRKTFISDPTESGYNKSLNKEGRCDNILKHKDFFDDEGTIVGIASAKGRETGAAVFILEYKGNIFSARPKMSLDERKEIYRDFEKGTSELIGKEATFRYQEISPDGVPRFPVFIAVRNYE
jgi:ATP-dependent DNA ligase